METLLGEYAYARPRFNLLLFAVFAALGLVLALFGIYGVISHTVAQQTREIGIRIALGAGFSQVIGMVLSSGARLLAIGIAVGLAASLASVKVLVGAGAERLDVRPVFVRGGDGAACWRPACSRVTGRPAVRHGWTRSRRCGTSSVVRRDMTASSPKLPLPAGLLARRDAGTFLGIRQADARVLCHALRLRRLRGPAALRGIGVDRG